jgi:raffinose/stachyose/melibiose transport system permease protein
MNTSCRSGIGIHALRAAKIAFLSLVALSMVFPFYWIVMSSFKSNNDIFANPLGLPSSFDFGAFTTAWNNARMGMSMLNSLFYCGASIVLLIIFASMMSFVLALVRKSRAIVLYFSFGLLIPIHAVIIPLNITLNQIGLGRTRAGLIIAYFVLQLSFSIILLTATMRSTPAELIDASVMDGCTLNQVFWNVAIPMSKAGIATIGTLAFISCWNDLLLGMVIAPTRELQTVNIAVSNLRVSFSDSYNVLAAGITCMFVPSVIVYSLFQKQIIRGLVSGAIKG